MNYVYILKCSDDSFYTGSTRNIEKRVWEHNQGLGANYTKDRLPVKVVFCEQFERIEDAFFREKQIQGWSRKKKIALIERRYFDLIELSKSNKDNSNVDG